MNVRELKFPDWPQAVPGDSQGRDVLYLLDSNEGLQSRVGERVEVTGTLDLRNVDEAQSTVTGDPTKMMDSVTSLRTVPESCEQPRLVVVAPGI